MVLMISTEAELENLLLESKNNLKLLIIDFFTTWCGPCLMFAPEFERLSGEYTNDGTFVKIDCDKLQDLAIKYGIKTLPTVKGFFNLQEVFSLSGPQVLTVVTEIKKNIVLPMLKVLVTKNMDVKPRICLLTVVKNIIENPGVGKYRVLKLKNTTVQNNLLAYDGVRECLIELGFREEGDKLVMEKPASMDVLHQFLKQMSTLVPATGTSTATAQGQSCNANVHSITSRPLQFNVKKKDKPAVILDIPARQFLTTIDSYRESVFIYENEDLMNIVRVLVDIEAYKTPQLSQELALKRLLRWFKYEFFSWFNHPICVQCNKPYSSGRPGTPTKEELEWLARRVEVYNCEICSDIFRFPRYNHPEKLLITRTGRCGEWANCFSLILRTFISEDMFKHARFVHDWSDHVWCEIYMKLDSESEPRWVHVDPCEGTYNAPLTYEVGWNKKLNYVIGISLVTGDVQDVTWRYTNNFELTLSRRKLIDEKVLVNKLLEYHKISATDSKLILEELVSFLPSKKAKTVLSAEEMMGRTTGSEHWRKERGELGIQPIWKKTFTGKHIKPTVFELMNKCIHIQYNCSIDTYHRPCDVEASLTVSGEGERKSSSATNIDPSMKRKISSTNRSKTDLLSHDTEGWQSLASSWTNVKRKIEYDWEVVYLARMNESEPEAPGEISWTIDLADTDKRIGKMSVFGTSAEFHGASVKWRLHSDAIEIPINGFVKTTDFAGCSQVTLTAFLEIGSASPGNNSWQHTQLFRQKSNDFDVKTLQIKVEICDR